MEFKIKWNKLRKCFGYLISLPKEVMRKKEGMTTPLALPIQSLAILFYQICQVEKYTCKSENAKKRFLHQLHLVFHEII